MHFVIQSTFKKFQFFWIALQIWITANILFSLSWLLFIFYNGSIPVWTIIPVTIGMFITGFPVLIVLSISLSLIKKAPIIEQNKKQRLLAVVLVISLIYGFGFGLLGAFGYNEDFLTIAASGAGALLLSYLIALSFSSGRIRNYFFNSDKFTLNKYANMETNTFAPEAQENLAPASSNRILYKAMITGILILVMLVPTVFINNLVKERHDRQADVVKEISDKWAQAQTLTGPYIYLPYREIITNKDKTVTEQVNHLIIIPDNLAVDGSVSNELRQRSIYKVLLYRAAVSNTGNFQFRLPAEVDSNLVNWQDAKICYGISDFKGIEEKLAINLGGLVYDLSPGLPTKDISENGLSAPIALSSFSVGKSIPFTVNIKIKGSTQLHFLPLSGDSRFNIKSSWSNPSFDGNNLPSVRTVNETGFAAMWSFNRANLPFGTVLNNVKFDQEDFAFGVTMVQPADGYAKTDRCIKYAILFIGLTFAFFFIIELLQKKPVHPVQYALIGLALTIFYTLLLSFSEFIPFDWSYLIAALATILLISFYAYGHFQSAKTATVLGGALSLLYGFTFVLIRLEDTALLIGSIGLFIILAVAMYFSRKINWYGTREVTPAL